MPDAPIQPDPQESTEAKLCAYLEGELSPADKIEIEQHLIANPQHRKLLGDLAKTRDWMRAIPRETSPVDLGEVFQGQVERSMLLDGAVEDDAGMSINRWPQYMVLAAITALTLGLGAVLVAVLSNPKSGTLANSGTSGFTADHAVNGSVPAGGSDLLVDNKPATAPTGDRLANEPPTSPPAAAVAPGTMAPKRTTAAAKWMEVRREQQEVSQAEAIKSRLTAAGIPIPGDGHFVCFVVSADTPTTAAEHLQQFFERHSIAFNGPPSPSPYSNHGGALLSQDSQRQNNQPAPQQNAQTNGDQVAGNPNNFTAGKQFQLPPAASPATAPAESFYVAHGLSPLQLELLNASLQTDDLKQTVQRIALSSTVAEDAKQPGQPITGPIQKGQTLLVTIPQLSRPTAGTDKTNAVRVADDGTITLPMIDPIPAAGLTTVELEKKIADKYREKDLISDATVTITAAVTATTQSAAATTAPVRDAMKNSLNLAAAPPVTQPAADTGPVDVVVLVQPSQFPLPITAPVK